MAGTVPLGRMFVKILTIVMGAMVFVMLVPGTRSDSDGHCCGDSDVGRNTGRCLAGVTGLDVGQGWQCHTGGRTNPLWRCGGCRRWQDVGILFLIQRGWRGGSPPFGTRWQNRGRQRGRRIGIVIMGCRTRYKIAVFRRRGRPNIVFDLCKILGRCRFGLESRQAVPGVADVRPFGISLQIRPIGPGGSIRYGAAPGDCLAAGRQDAAYPLTVGTVGEGRQVGLIGLDGVAMEGHRIGLFGRKVANGLVVRDQGLRHCGCLRCSFKEGERAFQIGGVPRQLGTLGDIRNPQTGSGKNLIKG